MENVTASTNRSSDEKNGMCIHSERQCAHFDKHSTYKTGVLPIIYQSLANDKTEFSFGNTNKRVSCDDVISVS